MSWTSITQSTLLIILIWLFRNQRQLLAFSAIGLHLLGAPLPYVNVVFVYIHKIIPLKAKKMQIKCLINLIQGYETNQGPNRASIIKTDIYQHRSIFLSVTFDKMWETRTSAKFNIIFWVTYSIFIESKWWPKYLKTFKPGMKHFLRV